MLVKYFPINIEIHKLLWHKERLYRSLQQSSNPFPESGVDLELLVELPSCGVYTKSAKNLWCNLCVNRDLNPFRNMSYIEVGLHKISAGRCISLIHLSIYYDD